MSASWTILLIAALLGSCSSQGASDEDGGRLPADRALQASGKAVDEDVRLRYSTGIRAIFEDSQGRFWFGSQDEGVAVYDGSTFTYYTTSDGLSSNQVRTIQEDQDGILWFGTGNGITRFDGDQFEIVAGGPPGSAGVVSEGLWRNERGDLWFLGDSGSRTAGVDGQGVYRYDGESMSYLAFPLPDGAGKNSPYHVTSIAEGQDGMVWFGTYPGVIGYDGESFTVIDDEAVGLEPGPDGLHVRSVFEDSEGTLWIGNNGIGVLRVDDQGTSNFTEERGLSIREKGDFGSLGRVFSIAEDARGHIWFGTRDTGAWRFDGQSLTNYTEKDGLTSPMVWTIYRDTRDALWFGLGDGSVHRFTGVNVERVY